MTITNGNNVETPGRSLLQRWRMAKGEAHAPPIEPLPPTKPIVRTGSARPERKAYADKGAPVGLRLRSLVGALEALSLDEKTSQAKTMARRATRQLKTATATAQVFVDESGRRQRTMRVVSLVLSILLGLFIAVTVIGLVHALAVFS